MTKKSSIQGFSFLLTYYEEKNHKKEWEVIKNHQASLYCKLRNEREIEAYSKRKNEQAVLLAEKEVTRPYIAMCMVALISPPCGRCICCCLVTRKVSHTALAPASWAVTSCSVDATLSGEFEESFLSSLFFLSFPLHAAHIQYHAFWREGKKERSGTLQVFNSSTDSLSHQGKLKEALYFFRGCSWLPFVRFWR